MIRALLHNNSGVNTEVDTTDLAHYYRLESDANDYVGMKHGTATNVTYGAGIAGNGAIFNGSAHILLPSELIDNANEYSFTFLTKADDTNGVYVPMVLNNNTRTGINHPFTRVLYNSGSANRISFQIQGGHSPTVFTEDGFDTTQILHIGFSLSRLSSTLKIFINGNVVVTSSFASPVQITPFNNVLGANRAYNNAFYKGKNRGVGIWNKFLSDEEMLNTANIQLAGDQLI